MVTSFKKFLAEKHTPHSALESILSQPSMPPVVFTPSMMKRLEYTYEDITGFHVTDFDGVKNLARMQGSAKQVSVFFNAASSLSLRNVIGGIETSGGYIAELKGDVQARIPADMFTGVVEGGRRSVLLGYGSEFAEQLFATYSHSPKEDQIKKLFDSLHSTLRRYQRKLIDEIKDEIIKNSEDRLSGDIRDQFDEMLVQDKRDITSKKVYEFVKRSNENGLVSSRMLQDTVSQYFDFVEKTLQRNPEYKQLFVTSLKENPIFGYDEGVISNFSVEYVHLVKGDISIDTDEIRENMLESDPDLMKPKRRDELQRKINQNVIDIMKVNIENLGLEPKSWLNPNRKTFDDLNYVTEPFLKYARESLRKTWKKLGISPDD